MAKRFIDTQIFRKSEIRGIKGAYKLLYIYMFCECNHAGIWDVELDVAGLRLGFDYDEAETLKDLCNYVDPIRSDKWYLTGFVQFQYGTLNPENRAHKSVIEIINKYNIKPLVSPSQGCKEMELDKVKDKEEGSAIRKSKLPTVDQWLDYAKSVGYPVSDATSSFHHYEANGWTQGKHSKPIKRWKSALQTCFGNWKGKNPDAVIDPESKPLDSEFYDLLEQSIMSKSPDKMQYIDKYKADKTQIPDYILADMRERRSHE